MTKVTPVDNAVAKPAPKVPVVNTAAEYAKSLPARAPAVSPNPTKIEFPRDEFQSTQEVRAAGTRAAGRVGMSDAKLELLLKTYDILKGHAVARHAQAKEGHSERLAAAAKRAEKDAALEQQRKLKALAVLEAQVKEAKAQLSIEDKVSE